MSKLTKHHYNAFTKADTSRPVYIDLSDKLVSTREDFFTEEQFNKAKEHYEDFTMLVNLRMSDTELAYQPSQEDKNEPLLWKPEHWKWFFQDEKELA